VIDFMTCRDTIQDTGQRFQWNFVVFNPRKQQNPEDGIEDKLTVWNQPRWSPSS